MCVPLGPRRGCSGRSHKPSLAEIYPEPTYEKDRRGVYYNVETKELCACHGRTSGKYEIKEGTTGIRQYAFQENCNLRELVFPESLEYIRNKACYWMYNLSKITFKSPKVEIASDAFLRCNYVECVVVPEGTKEAYAEVLPQWKEIIVEQK